MVGFLGEEEGGEDDGDDTDGDVLALGGLLETTDEAAGDFLVAGLMGEAMGSLLVFLLDNSASLSLALEIKSARFC